MKFICDSNYGERDISFAPLRAYEHDGMISVVNPCSGERGPEDSTETYISIEFAAKNRGFIRRFLADQK